MKLEVDNGVECRIGQAAIQTEEKKNLKEKFKLII
jgi:hypothetical protein